MALKKNIGLGIRTSLVLGASFLATSFAVAGGLFQISLSDYPSTAPMPTLSWELSNPLPPYNVIQSGTGTPNTQGILSINPTTDGVYDVRISGSHFLADKLASVRVHAYPDLGPYDVMLVNGDINQDNSVDLLDYFDLSDAYNTVPGDSAWNADCDLNGDESVDLLDYFILSENWELTGTENPRKLTTKGREFWLAFLRNDHHQEDESEPHERLIHVIGQTGTNLTFSGGAVGAAVQAQIPSAGVLEQVFSSTVEHYGNIGVSSHVVHASADKPVSLQQLSFAPASSEGYCVLPQNSLGLDHVVVSYPTREGAFLAVIAPFGNASHSLTSLQITPSVDIPGATLRPAGIPFNVTLASGEIYYLALGAPNNATEGAAFDLSGTIITSNHPVAVLSGARGARIPVDLPGATNHLVEQIPPVDQLDKDYLVAPLAGRTSAGRIRIVGSRDNTLVSGLGAFPALIHRGEMIEVSMVAGQGMHVTGSKPFLLSQFSDSATSDAGGDPSFLVVPGTNALGNRATIYTPTLDAIRSFTQSTVPWNHRVNVYCQSSAVGSLTHNGTAIPATSFSPIAGSPYSYASILVAPGTQVLVDPRGNNAGPVAVSGYGESWYDSYLLGSSEAIQYVGGLNSPPATPTGVSAAVLQDQETLAHVVNVSWTDNSTTEDGFFVDRKVGSGGWSRIAFVGANVTSYQDVSSPLDRIVSYRVRATGDQSSDPSAAADVVTPPVPPITATIDAVAHNQVKVDWADSSLTEIAYEVERKQDAGGWALVHTSAANATTWTDGSTGPLVNYTYRVRAKNGNLVSAWTGQLPILTPDIPPTPVTNLSGTPFDHQRIDLSWTPGLRATHVEIQRTKTPGNESSWATVGTYPVGTNSTSDSGLSGLTQYHYRARSKNTGGVSAWASTSATTHMPPIPTAPIDLVASCDSVDAVDLKWIDTSSVEDRFEVWRRPLGAQSWSVIDANLPMNSSTYTDALVASFTNYEYVVVAVNGAGRSISEVAIVQTGRPIPDEDGFQVSVAATGSEEISLYWRPLPSADTYRVWRQAEGSNAFFLLHEATAVQLTDSAVTSEMRLRFIDEDVVTGQEYMYFIEGVNPNGAILSTSYVDGDIPSSDSIDWNNQDPYQIMSQYIASSGLGFSPIGHVRVICVEGPNGISYSVGSGGVVAVNQPSDDVSPDGHMISDSDTGWLPAPDDDATLALSGTPNEATYPYKPTSPPSGVYRKVQTTLGQTSLLAVVTLPQVTGVNGAVFPYSTAYVYSGGEGNGIAVDAGFQKGSVSTPGWTVFATQNRVRKSGEKAVREKFSLDSQTNIWVTGSAVGLEFSYPSATNKVAQLRVYQVIPNTLRVKTTGDFISEAILAGFANGLEGEKRTKIRLKRVNSIAQQSVKREPPLQSDPNLNKGGYHEDSSKCLGAGWQGVRVSGNLMSTDELYLQGRYPNDSRLISWLTENEWFSERALNVQTKP